MPYCMLADLEKQISPAELVQLTDDAGTGEVDAAVIAAAISDADEEIDSYVGTRLTVPLSPVPGMVRKCSVDIAIYNLYSRKHDEVPESRRDRYKSAVAFLVNVAKGTASLGVSDPGGNPPETAGIKFSGNTQVFNPDKLTRF